VAKLIKKDFISEREYDRLEAAVDVAEANLAIAQKALSDSVIKAPFDGRISNTYVENFQAVLAKKPVVRLLDTTQIEMVVQVPENLISKVTYIPFLIQPYLQPSKKSVTRLHQPPEPIQSH